jgi:hypothetical protein
MEMTPNHASGAGLRDIPPGALLPQDMFDAARANPCHFGKAPVRSVFAVTVNDGADGIHLLGVFENFEHVASPMWSLRLMFLRLDQKSA